VNVDDIENYHLSPPQMHSKQVLLNNFIRGERELAKTFDNAARLELLHRYSHI
jgi:hypothetical protein